MSSNAMDPIARRHALRMLCAVSASPMLRLLPSGQIAQRATFANRIGWAYTARPGQDRAVMVGDLRRMRQMGANTIYICHNNPGWLIADADEPGLCPAVWFALMNDTPLAPLALDIINAVTDVIEASGPVGLEVILGIGYQIQMGRDWNAVHEDELRRYADGGLMSHWDSGPTASPYSSIYRRDIDDYYHWIDGRFVRPYGHVIAVNLADEPMGSDFSAHAKAAFLDRTGTPFDEAPQEDRGMFLSGVVADYATWSARRWESLNPAVWTMMTFHVERESPFLPDIERIFANTPSNFIFSADTHLDDGAPEREITPRSERLLFGMVRTLGWLSHIYERNMMLWTSTNAWGLKHTGGVTQALRNLNIVRSTTLEVSGDLGMLLAWGWNIRWQGVYDDRGFFPVDKDDLVRRVGIALRAARDALSSEDGHAPTSVLHVPSTTLARLIGERQFGHLADNVVDLSPFDFERESMIYLIDGPALDAAQRAGARIVDYWPI